MQTIIVRELKELWAEIKRRIREGCDFLGTNGGRSSSRVVPAGARVVLQWDDHLKTAVRSAGRPAEDVVRGDRDGRW